MTQRACKLGCDVTWKSPTKCSSTPISGHHHENTKPIHTSSVLRRKSTKIRKKPFCQLSSSPTERKGIQHFVGEVMKIIMKTEAEELKKVSKQIRMNNQYLIIQIQLPLSIFVLI